MPWPGCLICVIKKPDKVTIWSQWFYSIRTTLRIPDQVLISLPNKALIRLPDYYIVVSRPCYYYQLFRLRDIVLTRPLQYIVVSREIPHDSVQKLVILVISKILNPKLNSKLSALIYFTSHQLQNSFIFHLWLYVWTWITLLELFISYKDFKCSEL